MPGPTGAWSSRTSTPWDSAASGLHLLATRGTRGRHLRHRALEHLHLAVDSTPGRDAHLHRRQRRWSWLPSRSRQWRWSCSTATSTSSWQWPWRSASATRGRGPSCCSPSHPVASACSGSCCGGSGGACHGHAPGPDHQRGHIRLRPDALARLDRLPGRSPLVLDEQGAIAIPLVPRLVAGVLLVTWGARTNRRWTVVVAATLALPVLWIAGLAMLVGVIPELRARSRQAAPPPHLRRVSHRGSAGG